MAPAKTNYKYYIVAFMLLLIVYLVGSLYREFHYLDLGYLLVVIIVFTRFLTEKEEN